MIEIHDVRLRTLGTGAALSLVLAAACKKSGPPPTPPPPEVAVVTVEPQRLPTSFEFTGEVQPYRRVEVRARVDGVIVARPFTEGTVVKRGEVLYRLDRVRPEASYQAALARARNARSTLQRLLPLVKENAVAQQDVDNARAEAQAADAELARASLARLDGMAARLVLPGHGDPFTGGVEEAVRLARQATLPV